MLLRWSGPSPRAQGGTPRAACPIVYDAPSFIGSAFYSILLGFNHLMNCLAGR
jgi:hypothetical protein